MPVTTRRFSVIAISPIDFKDNFILSLSGNLLRGSYGDVNKSLRPPIKGIAVHLKSWVY